MADPAKFSFEMSVEEFNEHLRARRECVNPETPYQDKDGKLLSASDIASLDFQVTMLKMAEARNPGSTMPKASKAGEVATAVVGTAAAGVGMTMGCLWQLFVWAIILGVLGAILGACSHVFGGG